MALILQQIPSYQVGSTRRYANVRSKIDQSDPNPAHKLRSSLEDLTVDSKQGREINPRFSGSRYNSSRPDFKRRRTVDLTGDNFPRASVRKSPLAEYRSKRSASLDAPLGSIQQKLSSTFPPPSASKLTRMSRVAEVEHPLVISHRMPGTESEEDSVATGASVGSELSHEVTNSIAFLEDEFPEEDEYVESNPGSEICGMEVTSSNTETTVVLKHLLALSGSKPPSSDMTIIEEDELEEEDEYFESQDMPVSASSESSFMLPHPIPQLIVTCEGEGLVETIVGTVRDYTITPMSADLALITEEEEDENGAHVLSTRL